MVNAVRRFWVVTVVFVLVALAVAAAAATLPETKYEATATLLAQPDTERVDFAAVEAVRFLLPSLAQLVSTNTFGGEVGQRLEPPLAAADVDVKAEFEPGTGIVHVTASDTDPARAQRIAQVGAVLLGQQELSQSVEVVLLDPPELPTAPAGPGTVTFLVGGLILGILGGVLAAIVLAAAAKAREAELPPTIARVAGPQPTSQADRQRDTVDTDGPEQDEISQVGEGGPPGTPSTRFQSVERTTAQPEAQAASIAAAAAVTRAVPRPESLEADAERLGLEVLGVIPVKGGSTGAGTNGVGDFDDAFRAVGQRLVERTQNDGRLVVTSPRSAAGRTTVTANTAWALASSGVSVLAVDGDIENAMLHRFLRVGNDRGLSDLPTATLGQVKQDSAVSTLTVVAAGGGSVAGGDWFGEALDRVFAEAAASLVLVDCPALLDSSRAIQACRTSGRAILVVDSADPRSSTDLASCVEELRSREIEVLGVVINKASTRHV